MADSAFDSNPRFTNISRAPYELGYLLRDLPSDFSSYSPASPETLLIADAARRHADNANSVLLYGLEAIGELLAATASSKNQEIDGGSIANLGYLIQHLAVESQFLCGIKSDLNFAIDEQKKRVPVARMKGGEHE